jgi:hypothetical protein
MPNYVLRFLSRSFDNSTEEPFIKQVTQMSNMKVPEMLQDYINTSIAMEESWENFSDPARIPFDAIADQAEVDAAEGLFGVYLSAIDYDDEYYTLIDSIAAYREHDFLYDSGIELIYKTNDFQKAQEMTQDLHQVILRGTSLQEFQTHHGLSLQPDAMKLPDSYRTFSFSCFAKYWSFNVVAWCRDQGLEFNFLDMDLADHAEEYYNFYQEQGEVFRELLSNQDFDRLDQLRVALKIGRFAFVHPATHAESPC